jgi:hypothetical protein
MCASFPTDLVILFYHCSIDYEGHYGAVSSVLGLKILLSTLLSGVLNEIDAYTDFVINLFQIIMLDW